MLPGSDVSISARRSFQSTGASKKLLQLHARFTTIHSSLVERALRARGSPEFKLTADRHALKNTVGETCRADELAAARRVTTTFPDADHDVSVIVKCPLSLQVYLPKSSRSSEYFLPCIVSQSAASELAVFDGCDSAGAFPNKCG